MSPASEAFVATEDELQLAEKLLEVNNWKRSDSLSVDVALGIFKQSGLSFKQLRDIWTIADKNGSGNLSRDELTVAIRLMGWVQTGAYLSEDLLTQKGPLPHIKGLTNPVTSREEIPNITATDIARFRLAFNQLRAIHGHLDREDLKKVYLQSEISTDQVNQIMTHLSRNVRHETVTFNDFALGMHLVDTLKCGLISSVPSTISPQVYKILALYETQDMRTLFSSSLSSDADHHITKHSFSAIANPSPWPLHDVEADLERYAEIIEETDGIPGDVVVELDTKYGVSSAKVASIWDRSRTSANVRLTSTELVSIRFHLRKLMSEAPRQRPNIPPPSLPPQTKSEYPTAAEEKRHLMGYRNLSENTTFSGFLQPANLTSRNSQGISSTENASLPPSPTPFLTAAEEKARLRTFATERNAVPLENATQREAKYEPSTRHLPSPSPSSGPPAYTPFSPSLLQRTPPLPPQADILASDSILPDNLNGLRDEISHLTTLLKQKDVERTAFRDDLDLVNEGLRKDVEQFKLRELSLESALEQQEEGVDALKLSVSSLQWDILEHQVMLQEKQEALTIAAREVDGLRKTVEIQNNHIADLTDLAADMSKAIADAPSKPDRSDLRVLFLRASLRDAQETAAKAAEEASDLRQKAENQDRQIVDLRQRLADMESGNDFSVLRREMEEFKLSIRAEMQEMQNAFQRALWSTRSDGWPKESPNNKGMARNELSEDLTMHRADSEHGSPHLPPSSPLAHTPQIHMDQQLPPLTSDLEVDPDVAQLESDLQLFKRDLERKGYIGPEVIERFISNYDIEAIDLNEIGQLADADDDDRLSRDEIDNAVVLLKKKLMSKHSRTQSPHHLSSSSLVHPTLSTSDAYDDPGLTWSSAFSTARSSSSAASLRNPFSPGPPAEVDDDIYLSSPNTPVLLKRSYHPDKRNDKSNFVPHPPALFHDPDRSLGHLFS